MQAIEPFDVVVIVLVIGMTVRGGLSGIASQVLSILSIVLSWYVASRHFSCISCLLPQGNSWNQPVAIFVMFVLCNIVIRIATIFIQRLVKVGPLKEFDRQLGALLGLAKGLVLCLVITFFAVTLTEKSRQAVSRSQSGKYLVSAIIYVASTLPDDENHAGIKKELAKFTTIANESGMSGTTISDEVASLKQKLEKTVVAPNAADQLVREKESSNLLGSTSRSAEKTATPETNRTSLVDSVNQFFSSMSSRRSTSPAAAPTPDATGSISGVSSQPGGNVHPLESIASNFSGLSRDIPLGNAQVSINMPNDGPMVAEVRFPDLDAEIRKTPTISIGVNPGANLSVSSGNYTTIPDVAPSITDDRRVYSGSILQQQSFAPSSVAPSLGP